MAFTKIISQISPTVVKTGTGSTTPAGGTDDLLTTGNPVKFTPNVSRIRLESHGDSFTKRKGITAARYWDIALQFYMQGSGTAGDAVVNGFASISALLRAAAMTFADGASDLTYTPSTIATLEKCEIWGENNGLLHKALNCVGNIVLEGDPNGGLLATWTGRGDYAEPTIASISGFTGGTDRSQAFLNIGGTITPSGGSAYTPVITGFRFDRGVDVRQIPDANSATGIKEAFVANARPTMTLDIAIDKDGSANLTYPNIYAHLMASTVHDFEFTHGSGTGKEITFAATEAELTGFSLRDADGYLAGTLAYDVTHSTDEGEFSIVIGGS